LKYGEKMTQDNFEYYSDEDFAWTGIHKFYNSATFENKKGTNFKIEIAIDKNTPLDSDDIFVLRGLAKNWTWGEDRKIKAFNLLNYRIEENIIDLDYMTIRKSKKYDEIKYLLFDIGSFLDLYNKEIVSIRVNILAKKS
jgi:hypothetical protein